MARRRTVRYVGTDPVDTEYLQLLNRPEKAKDMMTTDTDAAHADTTISRWHRRIGSKALVMALASGLMLLASTGVAAASSTSPGTSSTSLTAGSLSIGATTNETISVPVAGTGNGILPSAAWSDSTGSGAGWNGTVALSDFTYTGSWTQMSGTTTALASASSAFTGTGNGVEYTVTVGSGGSGTSTPYTWTSTDATDHAGGSGTATNGTPAAIGTKGISINFASSTTYPSGAAYQIDAGTQSASALSLDTSATGVGITAATGTTSADPTFANNGTTVTGGGVGSSSYGTAVKFSSTEVNNGMGTYTVDPGAQVNADASSWAATYTAGVQYSIVTGP